MIARHAKILLTSYGQVQNESVPKVSLAWQYQIADNNKNGSKKRDYAARKLDG